MELETNLARNLSQTEAKASYDASCKRLLANKTILAWIMKSCLEEYRDCTIEEIVEKYIEGMPQIGSVGVHADETNLTVNQGETIAQTGVEDTTVTEGVITYDIRFFASVPNSNEYIRLIINVEAQGDYYPGYPIVKRGIYYCSRMISAQYGTEFENSHYENIKKVASIWVCLDPPKYKRNSMTRYRICEENLIGTKKEKIENYDLLSVLMLCLGTEEDNNYDGILKLLSVLLSSEMKAEDKKQILQKDFNIGMTMEMESEVERMCNLSELVERKGIEQGIEQGIKQGALESKKEIALKMRKKGYSDSTIADILEVGINVLQQWFAITNTVKL